MCDLSCTVLVNGTLTILIAYCTNIFQYKAQKDVALINHRIEFLKKFDQFFSFDYYPKDYWFKYETNIDENGNESKEFRYIQEYKKNLKDAASESTFLFNQEIGVKASRLIENIQDLFSKDNADLNNVYPRRYGQFIDSFLLSLKKDKNIIEEYNNIRK